MKKKSAKKIKRGVRGEEGRSVGVMKDKELMLVEIEASHTLGRWSGAMSCPGEKEVNILFFLIYYNGSTTPQEIHLTRGSAPFMQFRLSTSQVISGLVDLQLGNDQERRQPPVARRAVPHCDEDAMTNSICHL